MRSRSASAAALYQSWRVAMPASLPIASRSLVRIALLISASANSSIGWLSAGKFAGNDWEGKLGIPQLESFRIIRALGPDRNPVGASFVQCMHGFYART